MAMCDGPVLTIDPRRGFGAVCIGGTRIPADVVAGQIAAGDSVDEMMDDYDIGRDMLLLACLWYQQECTGSRRKWERKVAEAWDEWAAEAAMILGGHKCGPLADPPEIED